MGCTAPALFARGERDRERRAGRRLSVGHVALGESAIITHSDGALAAHSDGHDATHRPQAFPCRTASKLVLDCRQVQPAQAAGQQCCAQRASASNADQRDMTSAKWGAHWQGLTVWSAPDQVC